MEDIVSGGVGGGAAAPKGRRFAAGLIDLLLVPVAIGFVSGLILLNVPEVIRTVLLVLINIVWLVVVRDFLQFAPGRMMVGLKLESASGGKISLAQAFIRNILLVIPFVLVIGYIIEIVMLVTKGQRIADGWAKTKVVSA